jgi:hypothetical protein
VNRARRGGGGNTVSGHGIRSMVCAVPYRCVMGEGTEGVHVCEKGGEGGGRTDYFRCAWSCVKRGPHVAKSGQQFCL